MARLRVRELAEARGMSMTDLHLETNRKTPGARVAYTTISALWHNRTRRPGIDTLDAIARALDVRIGDLFANGEEDSERIVEPGLVAA